MNILTVVGARPQFVKAAVLSRAFSKSSKIQEKICHTGQHYDANMSDVFFQQMRIPKPHFNLAISGGSHGAMTGKMLMSLEEKMLEERPDLVLVYGDTNSTLAASLAASKLHIPVAHVEAGLRSFNKKMPEEINRILTDHVSQYLFCPTQSAIQNLQTEGVFPSEHIHVKNVGDVMYDAAIFYDSLKEIDQSLLEKTEKPYYLVTCHRAENLESKEKLLSIVSALKEIAQEAQVLFPIHPHTQKCLDRFGIDTQGLVTLPPVSYFDMLHLIQNSEGVLTDSGGLQKEAYFFSKKLCILREETEWVELLENQVGYLCNPVSFETILEGFSRMKSGGEPPKGLYGDGQAAEKIVSTLLESSS